MTFSQVTRNNKNYNNNYPPIYVHKNRSSAQQSNIFRNHIQPQTEQKPTPNNADIKNLLENFKNEIVGAISSQLTDIKKRANQNTKKIELIAKYINLSWE